MKKGNSIKHTLNGEFKSISSTYLNQLYEFVISGQIKEKSVFLWLYIVNNMNYDNKLEISIVELSVKTGTSIKHIYEYIKQLCCIEYIKTVKEKNRLSIYVNPYCAIRHTYIKKDILDMFDNKHTTTNKGVSNHCFEGCSSFTEMMEKREQEDKTARETSEGF